MNHIKISNKEVIICVVINISYVFTFNYNLSIKLFKIYLL
jgi:hypothetical protein